MTDFYALAPEQQAARLCELALAALPHWGITDARVTLVKMRENAVFRVDAPDGGRYALRIHRHGYHSDAALRSELQWMQALAQAGIDVPVVKAGVSAGLFETVACDTVPEPRQIDLFEWIDGRPIGAAGESLAHDLPGLRRMFHAMGQLCARLHNQASTWTPPPGFTRHAWDAQGLTGEAPFWGRFWELAALTDAQRTLIETARARVHAGLLAQDSSAAGYSMIHADLSPDNVMLAGDRLLLLDFDDAGFGWHLFELATALYFHVREDYYADVRSALIEGYRSHRPLSDAALASLPLFLTARGLTYLGWVHTRHETQTARELTPLLIDLACRCAQELVAGSDGG
ncbi:MAG: phosphotransferase [Gammaproteobacteria bacterium]|nr:phosphotransferase [Gammaproteobacteria bacterium]